MGNTQETSINTEELKPYLKKDITMEDLINLKKAFMTLDKENTGYILYDAKKLRDVNKYDLPLEDENGKISIDFKTFMEMMTDNIINNRKAFGREATTYESETSTVTCFLCPFKQ